LHNAVEELDSGLQRTNPDSGTEEDLNQGPPDSKSSALNHSATPPLPRAAKEYSYLLLGNFPKRGANYQHVTTPAYSTYDYDFALVKSIYGLQLEDSDLKIVLKPGPH